MKPGKNDVPVKVKISGLQLDEFQKHSPHMIEAFGLDTRVDNYKGKRSISFYSWDLDCILDVLEMVLNDEEEYPNKKDEGYLKLQELYIHLKSEYQTAYGR